MSADVSQFIRFVTTGSGIAVVYVALYTALIHIGVSPFYANLFSFGPSVVVQYVVQTCWTFRRPLWDGSQSLRFATVIAIGLLYSTLIASFIGPGLGWYPWASAGLVAVSLPVLNYLCFRFWVYRPKFTSPDSDTGLQMSKQ